MANEPTKISLAQAVAVAAGIPIPASNGGKTNLAIEALGFNPDKDAQAKVKAKDALALQNPDLVGTIEQLIAGKGVGEQVAELGKWLGESANQTKFGTEVSVISQKAQKASNEGSVGFRQRVANWKADRAARSAGGDAGGRAGGNG